MNKLNGNTLLIGKSVNNSNHHVAANNPLRDDAFHTTWAHEHIENKINHPNFREIKVASEIDEHLR